jgi:hypothetical protein
LAADVAHLQLLFGFDNDDSVGLDHFEKVIQPFLDEHDVSYEAQAFDSLGYAGLNLYYNHLGKSASTDWLFVWNDDAIMQTQDWDKVIESYTGQFKLLKVHTHNEHPYSIFPIVPRAWYDLFGHFSRHQMIDAEMSQMAFMLDLMQIVDIDVVHNQVELTKDASDPLKPKMRFEGNPNNPYDFHNPSVTQRRIQDCDIIANYMKSNNLDTTWWDNVKAGTQYPWTRMEALDINNQMRQFELKADSAGRVVEINPSKRHDAK